MTTTFDTTRSARANLRAAAIFALAVALCRASIDDANAQTPDVVQSGGVLIQDGGGVRGAIAREGENGEIALEPALGGSLVLSDAQIKRRCEPSVDLLKYRKFAPLKKDDVESHLEIARWANKNKGSDAKLRELAQAHYERVVELEPENAEARAALNQVKVDGVWISKEERREKTGLVRVNGRSVSTQEAELIRKAQETKEAARFWKKEIQALYLNARAGDRRQREALRSVRNPLALSTVVKLFESEKDPEGRILLIQTMSAIGNPAALSELGKIALNDPDQDARAAAVEGIYQKKIAAAEAIEFFRRQLRADDPAVVNAAAYALGRLEAERAVPDLINALVTARKRQIFVGSEQTGATFDGSGRVSNFSPGGGGKMKTVTEVSQNEAVRDALVHIVGAHYATPVNFGFDVDAWIRWRRSVDQLANFYPRRDR